MILIFIKGAGLRASASLLFWTPRGRTRRCDERQRSGRRFARDRGLVDRSQGGRNDLTLVHDDRRIRIGWRVRAACDREDEAVLDLVAEEERLCGVAKRLDRPRLHELHDATSSIPAKDSPVSRDLALIASESARFPTDYPSSVEQIPPLAAERRKIASHLALHSHDWSLPDADAHDLLLIAPQDTHAVAMLSHEIPPITPEDAPPLLRR
jgi:hypothetical protein